MFVEETQSFVTWRALSLFTSLGATLKSRVSKCFSWRGVLLFIVAYTTVNVGVAFCQDNGYSLMIQKSPPAGGIVSPDVGVRETLPNQTVLMTATPKKGYRFLYWLGDVEDPTRGHTSVTVDSPKMVIAVFERVGYQSPSSSGGGGGGRLIRVSSYSAGPASISPSPSPKPKPIPIPIPPIPEPVSFVLFGSGLLMLRSRRRLLRRS